MIGGGFSSGFSSGFGGAIGTYRFLADHCVNDEIISAGETRQMHNWIPTGDVDPLDATTVAIFYYTGPQIGGSIVSRWVGAIVAAPATYWYEVEPNLWALTGLGSNQVDYPPLRAFIGRIKP